LGGALFASASLDTCVKARRALAFKRRAADSWRAGVGRPPAALRAHAARPRQGRHSRRLRAGRRLAGVRGRRRRRPGTPAPLAAPAPPSPAAQLWDLAEGRLLAEFSPHPAAVTSLAFHPSELLLASSAGDGSARVWDLDARALLTQAPQAASPVRCCHFTPCGQALLAASAAGIAAHAWEPSRLADAVPLPWRRPAAALACRDGRLLAAAPHAADVAVWVVDLARVGPSGARLPGDALAVQSSSIHQLLPGPPMFRPPTDSSTGGGGPAMTLAALELTSPPPPPPLSPPPPLPPDPPPAPAAPPLPEAVAATALLAAHASVTASLEARLRALRALRVAWRRGDAVTAAAALTGSDGCAALGDALRSGLLTASPAPPPAAAAAALAPRLAELLAAEQPVWRREAALEAAEVLAPAAPGAVAQLRAALAALAARPGDGLGMRAARLAAALA